jgi:hypothetical protein
MAWSNIFLKNLSQKVLEYIFLSVNGEKFCKVIF